MPTIQLRNGILSMPLKPYVCQDEETCPVKLPVTVVSISSVPFWLLFMSLCNCEPMYSSSQNHNPLSFCVCDVSFRSSPPYNFFFKSSPEDSLLIRRRERERETSIGCLPYTPQLGIEPAA